MHRYVSVWLVVAASLVDCSFQGFVQNHPKVKPIQESIKIHVSFGEDSSYLLRDKILGGAETISEQIVYSTAIDWLNSIPAFYKVDANQPLINQSKSVDYNHRNYKKKWSGISQGRYVTVKHEVVTHPKDADLIARFYIFTTVPSMQTSVWGSSAITSVHPSVVLGFKLYYKPSNGSMINLSHITKLISGNGSYNDILARSTIGVLQKSLLNGSSNKSVGKKRTWFIQLISRRKRLLRCATTLRVT